MNTTMADGAHDRLDAQIAEALFGQPGMSKMDVANRVRELRGDGPALLADVQPGGMVRLGDHDEKPPQELPELIVTRGDGIPLPDQAAGIEEFKRQCLRRIEAEYPHLSAQPSPGGQGANSQVVSRMVSTAPERIFLQIGDGDYSNEPFPHPIGEEITWCADNIVESEVAYVRADLAARQPVGEPVVAAHRYIQRYQSAEHSTWLNGDADETYVEAERQGLGQIERAYAAPPAQAVDLEQFHALAAFGEEFAFSAEKQPQSRVIYAQARRLLALIDGKAVGNG